MPSSTASSCEPRPSASASRHSRLSPDERRRRVARAAAQPGRHRDALARAGSGPRPRSALAAFRSSRAARITRLPSSVGHAGGAGVQLAHLGVLESRRSERSTACMTVRDLVIAVGPLAQHLEGQVHLGRSCDARADGRARDRFDKARRLPCAAASVNGSVLFSRLWDSISAKRSAGRPTPYRDRSVAHRAAHPVARPR